ncbi:MAG: hypothetical protein M1379_11855 [Firmicutes bacterium]|nr:hypothetical protein [Bacillota bacterium]
MILKRSHREPGKSSGFVLIEDPAVLSDVILQKRVSMPKVNQVHQLGLK